MMTRKQLRSLSLGTLIALGAPFALPAPAEAHFQVLYTPELNHAEPGTLPFRLVFTHPADNGPVMDMATPEAFFFVHQGERTDLLDTLQPVTWTSPYNQGAAFEASVPVRRNGDYVFGLVPSPYLEDGEGYIQQFTKVIVNRGGMPSDWSEPLGFPAEIVPLVRPYALYTGMIFSGQVLSDGEPMAGAEIEVEYMNHDVLMDQNAFRQEGHIDPPSPAFETFTIHADDNGVFHFAVTRPGFWGFAALDAGPETEFNGEGLSQEAVMWVQAHDMR